MLIFRKLNIFLNPLKKKVKIDFFTKKYKINGLSYHNFKNFTTINNEEENNLYLKLLETTNCTDVKIHDIINKIDKNNILFERF